MKLKTFSRRSLLAAVMLLLFITNSCKKDALVKNPATGNLNPVNSISSDSSNIVTQKDILDWVKTQGPLDFNIQWDSAEQSTIMGQYAIKIPIAKDAALFFTKKANTLYTYIYQWVTTNYNDQFFTGKMIIYNLQTDLRYRVQYINGEINYIQVAKPLSNKSTTSNQTQAIKTQGLGYLLRYIGCILSGGDWVYGYYGDYCQDAPGFDVVFEDGGPGDAPPPIPQSAWDNSYGYNFSYYNSNSGSTQTFTEAQLSQMGGGVFWVKPPTFPGDENNGCGIVNESIKSKNVNDVKGTQAVKNQVISGCPTWTPYYFDYDNFLTQNDIDNAVPVDDGKPHIDVQKYINCFNDGQAGTYKLTLYINQPSPGTNRQFELATGVVSYQGAIFVSPSNAKFDVGHAFIGFEKHEDNGTVINQTLGFYPDNGLPVGGGEVKDDAGHPYNISYTITVTQAGFNAALNSAVSDDINKAYVLTAYNCSDAALDWMNATGASISPVSRGQFNNTPGDLGQAIKQRTGAQNYQSQQSAPASHGPCN